MKRFIFSCFLFVALLNISALSAATTNPADEVKAAIKNLADAPNYTWTVTAVETSPTPGAAPSTRAASTEGKTEKGGCTLWSTANAAVHGSVSKGDKYVIRRGTAWTTPEEVASSLLAAGVPQPPPAAMAALTAAVNQRPVAPADELTSLAAKVREFKSADGIITGELPTDYIVAQLLVRFAGSTYVEGTFSPTNTSGTLRIWLKDGVLTKYEVEFKGTVSTPTGTRTSTVDRTTTTEIKDIGMTKVEVPAAALAKLESLPATTTPVVFPAPAPATSTVPPGPVPPPPLTNAQKAVLQGSLADFASQFANATGIKLVPIPAGAFTMGSPKDEVGHEDEEGPQTQVTLTKNFFLGSTDVTQGQYEAVMGTNPSYFKAVGRDAPVEQVSWDDAMAFCQKLTERERAAGRLPAGYAFTLPTEAQWEYACRAGTTGPYAGDLDAMAWYELNSGDKTHPVGTKQPNAWGLYDMHGNVLEWCLDYPTDRHPGGAVTDPTGPAAGTEHVLRGGCWNVPADTCTSAMRVWFAHDDRENNIGFRIAVISTI